MAVNYSHGTSDSHRAFDLLLDLTEDFALEQRVHKPTRKLAVLDLIFTNNPDCMTECSTRELEGVSDHNLVTTKHDLLENLDLLTPNRLLLGRNDNRCPTAPLVLSNEVRKIVLTNQEIFTTWFRAWLVSYVTQLVPQPKWYNTGRNVSVGDVLFSKSDKEFENVYQYGIVNVSKDELIRSVDTEDQNENKNTKHH